MQIYSPVAHKIENSGCLCIHLEYLVVAIVKESDLSPTISGCRCEDLAEASEQRHEDHPILPAQVVACRSLHIPPV